MRNPAPPPQDGPPDLLPSAGLSLRLRDWGREMRRHFCAKMLAVVREYPVTVADTSLRKCLRKLSDYLDDSGHWELRERRALLPLRNGWTHPHRTRAALRPSTAEGWGHCERPLPPSPEAGRRAEPKANAARLRQKWALPVRLRQSADRLGRSHRQRNCRRAPLFWLPHRAPPFPFRPISATESIQFNAVRPISFGARGSFSQRRARFYQSHVSTLAKGPRTSPSSTSPTLSNPARASAQRSHPPPFGASAKHFLS